MKATEPYFPVNKPVGTEGLNLILYCIRINKMPPIPVVNVY